MAKKKRYPKKPKISANLETWKRWEKKAAIVKAFNNKIDAGQKAKETIKNKYT